MTKRSRSTSVQRGTAVLLLILGSLAGCGNEQPAPVAPVAPTTTKPAATTTRPPVAKTVVAPPLSAIQKSELEKSFTVARGYAKEAEKLKLEAQQIEKTQSRAAANETYVKAKDLYHKACEEVSDWLEGDLAGKVTDAQVKDYLASYQTEVGKWQQALGDIGKVHKDE